MTTDHSEKAFEDAIEAALLKQGWLKGDPNVYDRERALDPAHVFAFIEATQPDLWEQLSRQHGKGVKEAILDALTKALDSRGTLNIVRHGFKFYGKKIDMAYFRPAHGLNPDIQAKYDKNRLVVTRQVEFIPDKRDSIDMLLSLNGLPIATVELKNPLTNQNVNHAIKQYKQRDHKQKLFQYKKRTLVHFAVDPDLVYMTTRLSGNQTFFLPFNKGYEGGAGNPPNPDGHKTAYLWEEVWERHSFLDIIGRFMHLLKEERWIHGRKVTSEKMIFPRYHQLDSVRQQEAAAKAEGPGYSYLVQHSAGSGKSNSIAWTAHRLSTLHTDDDRKVFDSVVVVTDRRVLDKQLQNTIYQFEHKQGVVARIDKHSAQLADALATGTPIIITTLQKFPFVTEKIGELPNRKYAVIVDEAHSSQTGETARQMKEVLAASSLEDAENEDATVEDYEDEIVRVMQSRGRQGNLSYFAFTATPKAKTLEMFGRPGPDSKPVQFHLYTMRQAIDENFILDVLQNYTTYKTYYKLVKAIEEDPRVDKKKAAAALARFMSLHPHNIAQKTEVMIEHFRQKVMHRIGGRAKAMVVTRSRLHAVKYKLEFDRYIAEKGYDDIAALVAFSGTVQDPDTGAEYTERQMNNGIPETGLTEEFATDRYQLLLVASKYQTGFDEPLLHTMYVDRKLTGLQAVQTLSRVNRTHPGKEDTFILDFCNEPGEIYAAFKPYYERTEIEQPTDPQQLYDLQHKLDEAQVYYQSEVEAFCRVFYRPKSEQRATDHAQLYHHLEPALHRFKALDDEAQEEFRNSLNSYVRLYAFVSQIMPYYDVDLEKLYSFCRFLRTRLPRPDIGEALHLDDEVALKYYRLEKVTEGSIVLTPGEGGTVKGPTEVGTRDAKEEEIALSQIIEILNERFGTDFKPADELFFDQVLEEARNSEEVVQRAVANDPENFELSVRGTIMDLMVDRLEQNEEIVSRYVNEDDFQRAVLKELARRLYEEIREGTGD